MLSLRMLAVSIWMGGAATLALTAMAADQDLAGRRLYANCAACHGTDGRPAGNAGEGSLPPLAGQPKQQLIASMQAFKAGERQATIMHQIAKGYTDEQIALIAGFLANQKKQEAR
ncbi:c-type cytochrome [Noviherbaspirillum malthae]|uniref:c-type cytochrome n=1 Tax=Noviherbaspirillum malthae TaxID=1260987 RepID=UPI00188EE89C|nr:c-type cytochrome [Noviherbaspirillum malthae]